MENPKHPHFPQSNVSKFSGYDPSKYQVGRCSDTVTTDESIIPGHTPCLNQKSVALYLQPLTKELNEVPPRPTIDELPDAVIDQGVLRDKAFWVDKPGANAYTLHDAYYNYGLITKTVKPTSQKVFPRSYQYDLDCVRYRRQHACDGLKETGDKKKPLSAHCRDCQHMEVPALSPFQLAWAKDPGQKRWRYYPDLTATLSPQKIREMMDSVGRPFQNEACNWYYENYPPVKYETILRKFSQ